MKADDIFQMDPTATNSRAHQSVLGTDGIYLHDGYLETFTLGETLSILGVVGIRR